MRKFLIFILFFTALSSHVWSNQAAAIRKDSEVIVLSDEPTANYGKTKDFLAMQIVPRTSLGLDVKQYLGGVIGGGFGSSFRGEDHRPLHGTAQVGLSYLVTWSKKDITYVGIEIQGSMAYSRLFNAHSDFNQMLNPIISPFVKIYLDSPAYIGLGMNLGVNVLHDNIHRLLIGPALKLGFFQDFGSFGLDVAFKWEYFTNNSDMALIYELNNGGDVSRSPQVFSIAIGLYGLL